mmetsp:Transcript_23529/g.59393  ORF Transcript_23529/g.59393 Transcript_23529/m.59393 type:complete len:239 (+) Transcript_23529:376-1092(+)
MTDLLRSLDRSGQRRSQLAQDLLSDAGEVGEALHQPARLRQVAARKGRRQRRAALRLQLVVARAQRAQLRRAGRGLHLLARLHRLHQQLRVHVDGALLLRLAAGAQSLEQQACTLQGPLEHRVALVDERRVARRVLLLRGRGGGKLVGVELALQLLVLRLQPLEVDVEGGVLAQQPEHALLHVRRRRQDRPARGALQRVRSAAPPRAVRRAALPARGAIVGVGALPRRLVALACRVRR